ncbi:hypothetical protein PPL_12287 [Heterostelium album PN500]|uniref:Uncharacterized protein n=1 Tax=Heterostelium pallidum (strain ATCC 26659 / Pp 5 / PN500) TaxID=670386 RepID=D3BM77_HETP5|nr:hypothetical protein PPL_12287 [Heterostelium album PN500]EFA77678.1 hypothetical protein PPL_12287 [Heterostelium album PN500]|eukprot:XP_020429806.1 hypothetical protein PPL_12287 [Heterostelium album PN500]
MLSSEEHREACRVYMQKYRSKPENREKIRQQNAEYRKRKKLESIRQVSEIGNLEQNLDSYQSRISMLEKDLKEALFKVAILEQDTRIPQSYIHQLTSLKSQLDHKQHQIDVIISASASSIQTAQNSIATAYQGLISTIHQVTSPTNSPPASPVAMTPSNSPVVQSVNNNQQQPTIPPLDFKLKNKTIDLFSNEQPYFGSGQPSPSSPPSSPSLHFLTSPSSSSSNFASIPALANSTGSFGLVPDTNTASSPTPSTTFKAQSPESKSASSTPQLSSVSGAPATSPNHVANHPLSLLCDVLQNETYTNQQQQQQQSQIIQSRPIHNNSSSDFSKTAINFVLNSGASSTKSF